MARSWHGAGFDTHALRSGYGLKGMRERVTLVGGTLEIVSDDAGTCVRARLPRGGEAAPVGVRGARRSAADQTLSRPRSSA